MRTTIDAAGRIVIPQRVRQRLGLHAGSEVELTERGDAVEVSVAPVDVRAEERSYGPVLVVDADVPPLTDADVRATVEAVRR